MMRLFALVFLVALAGCTTALVTPPQCVGCAGCCDATGACRPGNEDEACGASGFCDVCAPNVECLIGRCNGPSALTGLPDGGISTDAPGPWANEMVTVHNRWRASGAIPAPNPPLAPMVWSERAAAFAAAYVQRCRFVHSASGERGPLGENLFAGGGTGERTATEVTDAWGNEVSDYSYSTNTCRPGRQCGHYTQIVWRQTTGVGCAQKLCNVNSPFGSGPWWLVSCNYEPPGNFVGRKPY